MNPSLQAQEYVENDISEESCLATLISPLLEYQAVIRSNATCLCKISPSRQHQRGETLLFKLMRINYSFLWAIRSVPFLSKQISNEKCEFHAPKQGMPLFSKVWSRFVNIIWLPINIQTHWHRFNINYIGYRVFLKTENIEGIVRGDIMLC